MKRRRGPPIYKLDEYPKLIPSVVELCEKALNDIEFAKTLPKINE